ncbi:MAG: 2-C-methyl-D-erythritol 2,4-cyclodiphosphate synthase [Bacteroidetes bacterium 4572_112]|nr:MAG: 2-C-methyl-D-erythritol 2,4-cyclodiphosphate synthase [Bacteroidetes bacterium 4572_112]
MRIGFGTDTHRLVIGKKLIVGGIEIANEKGCDGHSDGDALIHAICDSMLGALALRDIGYHFPDNSAENKDRDSAEFLIYVSNLIKEQKYKIANIDTTIHIQAPKMNPHIEKMQARLSEILKINKSQVSIKAKTGEKVGIIGRGEVISVDAVVLLLKNN